MRITRAPCVAGCLHPSAKARESYAILAEDRDLALATALAEPYPGGPEWRLEAGAAANVMMFDWEPGGSFVVRRIFS